MTENNKPEYIRLMVAQSTAQKAYEDFKERPTIAGRTKAQELVTTELIPALRAAFDTALVDLNAVGVRSLALDLLTRLERGGHIPDAHEGSGVRMEACVKGRLYKFRARNFTYGVFDGKQGFIGIREKFGNLYLDTEYHWDKGPPYGTVWSVTDTEIDCPPEIPMEEFVGVKDFASNRIVAFDDRRGGSTGWYFVDTGESSTDIRACDIPNEPLFEWLQQHKTL